MRLLLLLLLIILARVGHAVAQQTEVSGSIVDSTTNQAVEFVTIALMKGQKIIHGVTADKDGKFVIKPTKTGKYTLQVSMLGYETKTLEPIAITDHKNIELGIIKLTPSIRKLGEVTVTEQKSLFEERADRMVYNAEKDISVKGGDATDVLKKIPGMAVDIDGNVQLRGSSNIKVLVNNKPSSIVARSVSDALKQIPADLIKQVEVITAPSAKYDAEGTAGIINIITKKNSLQGTSGSVSPNFGQWNNWQNATINHRVKGISIAANGGFNNWKNKREMQILRVFENENSTYNQNQVQNITGKGRNFYGNLNVDWDLDSLNRIGGGINYYNGINTNAFDIHFKESNQGIIQQSFQRDMNRTYDWSGATINLDYTRLFKKPKKEVNLLMMYSFEGENSDYLSHLINENNTIYYREKSYNISNNKEGTVQLDFTQPIDSLSSLEMGAKTIFRNILSDYRIANATNGSVDFTDQPSLADVFDYAQQVASAYMVYSRSTRNKWGLNLGARYELTFIQAHFLNQTSSFSNHYGNFIPNISLSRGLKKEQQIRFSYTQRIQRPQFYYLNPYINQADSKNQYGGNPYLKPELTHAVEANYSISIKQTSWNTSLFLRQTNNAIEGVNTVDSAGVMLQMFKNVAQNSAYGASLSANTKINKKWSVNTSLNLFYNVLESKELKTKNQDWMYRINLNSTIDLGRGFKAQLFGFYNSPRVSIQGKYGGFGYYNMVLQKEILKKKGTIGIGYDNPFTQKISWKNEFIGPNFEQTQHTAMYRRGWRLNLKYEFGKMNNSPRQKKKISNDDKKAGEGNG